MNGQQCYQVWTATNLHCFSESYDALKYNFKVKTVREFDKHRDRFVYQSISKNLRSTADLINFSLANVCKDVRYIRDATMDNYFEFNKIQEGLPYWFEQDINIIVNELNRWVENEKNPRKFFINASKENLPRILSWYRQNKLHFQTIAILHKLYSFVDNIPYSSIIHNDLILFLKKSSKLLFLGEQRTRLKETVDEKIIRPFNIKLTANP